MNTLESISKVVRDAPARIKLNRHESESEPDHRLGYDTADAFRYKCSACLNLFRPTMGDQRRVGDDVVEAARLIAESTDGELSNMANSVADEWESITNDVVGYRKKLEIAEENSRRLITLMNKAIYHRVIKEHGSRHVDDDLLGRFCEMLGSEGRVIPVQSWQDILHSGQMNELLNLHDNKPVAGNLNRTRILWRQTIGETNRL